MLLDMAKKKGDRASQEPPQTRWVVGRQTVILGDCLTELRTMPSDSVDVVVTSPPYNIGVAYRSYQDKRPRQSYLDWLTEARAQMGWIVLLERR
jgi:site-specific DNA-methyltransferase (adenine-specific)